VLSRRNQPRAPTHKGHGPQALRTHRTAQVRYTDLKIGWDGYADYAIVKRYHRCELLRLQLGSAVTPQ